jgi:hypothetical protein
MCEILVRAIDGTCDIPAANPLRGMPVVVQPDGHTWGNGERLPEYVIIKLPGVSPSLVVQYTARWEDRVENGDDLPTITIRGRRRYLVPGAVVSAAEANGGTLTRTGTQFISSLIDRAA